MVRSDLRSGPKSWMDTGLKKQNKTGVLSVELLVEVKFPKF